MACPPSKKSTPISLTRFREGTPNNSLQPFLLPLLLRLLLPLSSPQCRVFPVALLLLRGTHDLPGSAVAVLLLLLRLRPFDVSDPASLGVGPSSSPSRGSHGRGRTDEMERQTKQRWETRGTSHGLKGGDGTENRLQVPIIVAGRPHHLGAVLTTRMAATEAKKATEAMMPTKFLGCH